MTGAAPANHPTRTLPGWSSVLAVVAHPDDESFGLGAILDSFGRAGSQVSVLCLTHGEASTLGPAGDLAILRAAELKNAAKELGVDSAVLLDHPDGALADVGRTTLTGDVLAQIKAAGADGLLVFDPSGVSGHPDHAAATAAALAAARCVDLPVLGWTVPRTVADRLNGEFGTSFIGHDPTDIDLVLRVDRQHQRIASLAHASQAVPTTVLWHRLDLLGDEEHLRWLRRQAVTVTAGEVKDSTAMIRVDHRSGDRFGIRIRNHVLSVDQPIDAGGEDTAPTPTELFVASLTSCVAFYARRYLHRHHFDTTGLVVDASFQLANKPARVDRIDITIRLADDLPPVRRDALLAVARHCTVHNSITTPPDISIDLHPPTPPS
ncbi:PIG-L family deacetylase [Kribbella sp. NBC_01510]|uniref:PIG-L family deacetylase n=1 Tax=Kribbella sp. NBC_01510 TaxID=2903581 RepID=UPI0038632850